MLNESIIQELSHFSTPSVLNGLKHLGQGPELLESVDRQTIRCLSPSLGVTCGYAATMKVETDTVGDVSGFEPSPLTGQFYREIAALPEPRILVVENVGHPEGPACIWGEVMANVYRAMGCQAGLTNGAVRDLPEMELAGFQTFANGLAVGGGLIRTIEVGTPVVVGGVKIESGNVLHGDMHGILKVPDALAPELPAAIRAVEAFERRVVEFCRSSEFSLKGLAQVFTSERH